MRVPQRLRDASVTAAKTPAFDILVGACALQEAASVQRAAAELELSEAKVADLFETSITRVLREVVQQRAREREKRRRELAEAEEREKEEARRRQRDAAWAAMLRARETRKREEEAAAADAAAVSQEAQRAVPPAQPQGELRGAENDVDEAGSRVRVIETPASAAERFMRSRAPVHVEKLPSVRRPWNEYARERPRASRSELGFG